MTLIDGAPAERLAADVTALVDGGEVTVHEDTGIPYVGDEELRSEVAAATEAVAESTNC